MPERGASATPLHCGNWCIYVASLAAREQRARLGSRITKPPAGEAFRRIVGTEHPGVVFFWVFLGGSTCTAMGMGVGAAPGPGTNAGNTRCYLLDCMTGTCQCRPEPAAEGARFRVSTTKNPARRHQVLLKVKERGLAAAPHHTP